jgi:hypothetical protein
MLKKLSDRCKMSGQAPEIVRHGTGPSCTYRLQIQGVWHEWWPEPADVERVEEILASYDFAPVTPAA